VGDPTFRAASEILEAQLVELRETLDGCSVDELNRRPAGDGTNSVAVLVAHALGATRSWLALATASPLPERDREAEFRTVVRDAGAFVAWFEEAAASCRALLDVEGEFDPGRIGTAPWTSRPDEPVTAAWALIHALEHLSEHVGHAQLTRQVV
jgi:uncharacterized damage-inducible protein DinB